MRMKEIKPGVRAIVASGYLEPSVRSEILKAGVIDTIQKPYDLYELIDKIHAVIGKAQSEDDHPAALLTKRRHSWPPGPPNEG